MRCRVFERSSNPDYLGHACSFDNDYIVNSHDVANVISKLNAHKNDGSMGLSTDHFLHGGADLHMHIAFLLTSIVVHGSVPRDFLPSTVIPIPKKPNVNATQSGNYRGIALSSCFCKILDNIILAKNIDSLNTSELQFGFKRNKFNTHVHNGTQRNIILLCSK